MTNLSLRQINFGKIDAKNELLTGNYNEKVDYENSFLVPPNITIDDFLNKDLYFIVGLKGTGKTALLRYISIISNKMPNLVNDFILFKSDFNEEDKKELARAAHTTFVERESVDTDETTFENVWKWFIHRRIVDITNNATVDIFKRDENWEKYKSCIEIADSGKNKSGIIKLFPKIRRGSLEVSASPKLGLEFDWDNDEKTSVKFSNLVKQADKLFGRLVPTAGGIRIYVDELEVSIANSKAYNKDLQIIGDLLIAIEKINATAKKMGIDLCVYAAIRSEILSSIESVGREINKTISDFSKSVIWHSSGSDETSHPLLRLVSKRIQVSEEKFKISAGKKESEIWKKYFDDIIFDEESQKFVLHQTWYKPRDIVRLFNIIKEFSPDAEKLTQVVFEKARKEYSLRSWVELSEELAGKYSKEDISAIKYLFNGFKSTFNLIELNDNVSAKSKIYTNVDSLFKRVRSTDLLADLYRCGIIGNYISGSSRRTRFSFRNDLDILYEHNFIIHPALKPYLSL